MRSIPPESTGPSTRSPSTRQSPDARCHQFYGIPGRVTEVKGLAASRPLDLFLDADAVILQELPPGVEGLSVNAQGEMAWAGGSMRRQMLALQRSFGHECEQDAALARLEENVMARLLADDR